MFTSFKRSIKARPGIEQILWLLLLMFIAAVSFSIAVSHIFLALTSALYFFWKLRKHRRFPRVRILLPALAFTYCTLLSVVFSIHPSMSVFDAKNVALFMIIPIFYDVVRDLEDVKIVYGILILAGVISASYGIFQFFASDVDVVNNRIKGFNSHWMTFSGLLMILDVLLLSHLLFSRRHAVWFYPAFAVVSLALLLSLTRNAWIGFLGASFLLIAMRKVRWVFAIPAVILIVFVASVLVFPTTVGRRITSVFNPNETSNRDRLHMMASGWEIIKDYPLTGVGNDMIKRVYPKYRMPDSAFRINQHLHNNLVQLAAENGILTLAAWIWLIARVVFDLLHWKRHVMNDEEQFMIHGTLGVIVAVLIAGMFEYNFGDSEVKMIFLALITLPYAWHRTLVRPQQQAAAAEQPVEYIPVAAASGERR